MENERIRGDGLTYKWGIVKCRHSGNSVDVQGVEFQVEQYVGQ